MLSKRLHEHLWNPLPPPCEQTWTFWWLPPSPNPVHVVCERPRTMLMKSVLYNLKNSKIYVNNFGKLIKMIFLSLFLNMFLRESDLIQENVKNDDFSLWGNQLGFQTLIFSSVAVDCSRKHDSYDMKVLIYVISSWSTQMWHLKKQFDFFATNSL